MLPIFQWLLTLFWGPGEFSVVPVQPQSYAGHVCLGLNVGDFLMFLSFFLVAKVYLLSVWSPALCGHWFMCGGPCVFLALPKRSLIVLD